MQPTTMLRTLAGVGALAVALGACSAGVKQEALSSDLQQLREEMRAGDQQVAANANQRIDSLARHVNTLDRDLQAFQRDFNAKITQLEAKLAVQVPVHFAFDSHTIQSSETEVLDRFASIAKEHFPNSLITIEGFADPAGSAAYNKQLGERRAEAVKAYLTERGVDGALVKTVSYGEQRDRQVMPGAHGPGETGRENRRVSFVIDYNGGNISEIAAAQTGGR